MSRFRLALLGPLLCLALVGCGSGALTSEDADAEEILDAWAEIVCVEDPDVRDRSEEPEDETDLILSATCVAHDSEAYGPSEATLNVYRDPQDAQDYTSANDAECDVPYSVVSGPRWVSYHDNGYRADELLDETDGELICEGE